MEIDHVRVALEASYPTMKSKFGLDIRPKSNLHFKSRLVKTETNNLLPCLDHLGESIKIILVPEFGDQNLHMHNFAS